MMNHVHPGNMKTLTFRCLKGVPQNSQAHAKSWCILMEHAVKNWEEVASLLDRMVRLAGLTAEAIYFGHEVKTCNEAEINCLIKAMERL